MNNIVKVDIQYVTEILDDLRKNERFISTFYEDKIDKLLKDNYQVIIDNSIDYYEYTNKIKLLVDELYDEISNLRALFEFEIIPGYEDAALSVKRNFNSEFHEEVNSLLDLINKDN